MRWGLWAIGIRLRLPMSKYKAIRTEVDGITFASKKEAKRYQELKLLEKAGQIFNLALQPRFDIYVGDTKVCTYVGDFKYTLPGIDGPWIIEDVKGVKTPVYNLKKKMMRAMYGIEIKEV
jgi:hypothetical protein